MWFVCLPLYSFIPASQLPLVSFIMSASLCQLWVGTFVPHSIIALQINPVTMGVIIVQSRGPIQGKEASCIRPLLVTTKMLCLLSLMKLSLKTQDGPLGACIAPWVVLKRLSVRMLVWTIVLCVLTIKMIRMDSYHHGFRIQQRNNCSLDAVHSQWVTLSYCYYSMS